MVSIVEFAEKLRRLRKESDAEAAGGDDWCKAYFYEADAKGMFQMICYGYMQGICTNRDLEKACRYRVDFMWLLGDEKVADHCSFARFRKRHAAAIENLFYQYVNLSEQHEETDHEVCFIDGTKLESRAGRCTFVWRGAVEKATLKSKRSCLADYRSDGKAEIENTFGNTGKWNFFCPWKRQAKKSGTTGI